LTKKEVNEKTKKQKTVEENVGSLFVALRLTKYFDVYAGPEHKKKQGRSDKPEGCSKLPTWDYLNQHAKFKNMLV